MTASGNTASWGGIDVSEGRSGDQEEAEDVVITEADLLTWSVASLMEAGAERRPAEVMARILLSADKRGHYSHGFNRLDIYHGDIVSGICQAVLSRITYSKFEIVTELTNMTSNFETQTILWQFF